MNRSLPLAGLSCHPSTLETVMFITFRRFIAAGLVATATVGLGSPASAQFYIPGALPGAGLPAMGVMGQAAAVAAMSSSPYGAGLGSPYGANPYGAGYPYPYYPDIYGGYLRGVADVTQANAQYQ